MIDKTKFPRIVWISYDKKRRLVLVNNKQLVCERLSHIDAMKNYTWEEVENNSYCREQILCEALTDLEVDREKESTS